jgi:diaminopimelate decarboxylase
VPQVGAGARPSSGPRSRAVTPRQTFPGSGTDQFHLVDGAMRCEDVAIAELAERFGTPLYVYSRASMEERFDVVRAAFGADARICYAVKANPNLSVLRVFGERGASFDVVSGGELARVQAAGFDTSEVVFAGVGKTRAEMDEALRAGILAFHVESAVEIEVLDDLARARGARAPVALRLNPDVDVDTHAYISTGRKQDKFGLDLATAGRLVERIAASTALRLRGYHVHLGSQLKDPAPYAHALDRVEEFVDAAAVRAEGVEYFDVGGGFGIAYGAGGTACDVGAVAAAVVDRIRARGWRPTTEPGRFLVGDAGVLVTRVLARKDGGDKGFLVCDAAMNDLIRPALYGAHHPVAAVVEPGRPSGPQPVDVVGPVCESGDFLARSIALPPMEEGDLLAVLAAGAYGASMASNYNSRPRPAEVLVDGKDVTVCRRRETYADLYRAEIEA